MSRLCGCLLILLLTLPSSAEAGTKRNPAVVREFKWTHICPSTGTYTQHCPGFVVDHLQSRSQHGNYCRDGNNDVFVFARPLPDYEEDGRIIVFGGGGAIVAMIAAFLLGARPWKRKARKTGPCPAKS